MLAIFAKCGLNRSAGQASTRYDQTPRTSLAIDALTPRFSTTRLPSTNLTVCGNTNPAVLPIQEQQCNPKHPQLFDEYLGSLAYSEKTELFRSYKNNALPEEITAYLTDPTVSAGDGKLPFEKAPLLAGDGQTSS
mmetsp:Transcript_53913/g.80453  ORF Transcript_53913/g.80453 Transcript_53913/m.80453 type:complete len:135 (-) Transcript_53913:52-456(-)